MAYGYDIQGEDDPYIGLVGEAMDQFSEAFRPGAYLVDALPFLRYVPSWVPGTGFLHRFAHVRQMMAELRDVPWADFKEAMVTALRGG